MRAITRVLRAPGLVLVLFLLNAAMAATLGSVVRTLVSASMVRFSLSEGDSLLFGIGSLLATQPAVAQGISQLLLISLVYSLLFWTLVGGGVFERLGQRRSLAETAAGCVRWMPAMIVVGLWHLVPRLIVLGIGGSVAWSFFSRPGGGWPGLAILVVTIGFNACALDLARANIVLHGARPWHPWSALQGYFQALKRPGTLLMSLLATAIQWTVLFAMLAIGIDQAGAGATIWVVRGLSLVTVVLILWRMAIAVEAGPHARGSAPSGSTDADL